MDPEQRRIIGNEAKQVLENKHLKEAFEAVDTYLNQVALACDPDNKDKASRIIISKQLLAAIKRELERKIEDGEIADIEINELERKKGLLRFIR
jgi:hypothetical protein